MRILAAMALIGAFNAHAMRCEDTEECFNQSVRLVKRATKLKVCNAQVKEVLAQIGSVDVAAGANKRLETCLKGFKVKK